MEKVINHLVNFWGSRKLVLSLISMKMMLAGAWLCTKHPEMVGIYPVYVSGILAATTVFSASNVTATWVAFKGNQNGPR
jgi:hypothetical protein